MKKFIGVCVLFSGILFSGMVHAESAIECEALGGSEQALSIAPKKIEVSEAGSVSLYTQGFTGKMEERMTIDIDSEEGFYYGTQGIKIRLSSKKRLLSEGSVEIQGSEEFAVKGCKNQESTTAIYNFTYKKGSQPKSVGLVTYKCECSID